MTPASTDAPERPAFDAIYAAEFEFVWRTLRRLGGPARDLPDLAHDVFVVVHRRIGDYDPSRPLRPWIFGICYRVVAKNRNLARNRKEHVGETDVGSDANIPQDDVPRPDDRLVLEQQREDVRSALEALDLERRAVLVLHDVEGWTMQQISEALGVKPKTLYARLYVARNQFTAAYRRLKLRRGEP